MVNYFEYFHEVNVFIIYSPHVPYDKRTGHIHAGVKTWKKYKKVSNTLDKSFQIFHEEEFKRVDESPLQDP